MSRKASASNIDIMNAVRQLAPSNYKERIPEATKENIEKLSEDIYTDSTYQGVYNTFIQTMLNKIALTLFVESNIVNIYDKYIKYSIKLGEVIEQISVLPARGENFEEGYDRATGNYDGVNDRRITMPDVEAIYYDNRSERKYRVTIKNVDVRRAFTSSNGLSSLIGMIVNSLGEGANLDEYNIFKEVINQFVTKDIRTAPKTEHQKITLKANVTSEETAKDMIITVKNLIANMGRPNNKYNCMRRLNQQRVDRLDVFVRQDISNFIAVDVLSSAFNPNNLNLAPNDKQGLNVQTIDTLGGELPCIKDGTNWKLIYTVYNKYGMFTHYSESENGEETKKDVYLIPNYRFDTLPTYTVAQPVVKDFVALVIDENLPIIAIEEDKFTYREVPEGLYSNYVLIRFRKYAFNPFANGVVIFEPNTDVSLTCKL